MIRLGTTHPKLLCFSILVVGYVLGVATSWANSMTPGKTLQQVILPFSERPSEEAMRRLALIIQCQRKALERIESKLGTLEITQKRSR